MSIKLEQRTTQITDWGNIDLQLSTFQSKELFLNSWKTHFLNLCMHGLLKDLFHSYTEQSQKLLYVKHNWHFKKLWKCAKRLTSHGHSHVQGAKSLRYSGSSNSPGTSISKKRGSPPSLPVSQNVSYFQPTSHDGKKQVSEQGKKKRKAVLRIDFMYRHLCIRKNSHHNSFSL